MTDGHIIHSTNFLAHMFNFSSLVKKKKKKRITKIMNICLDLNVLNNISLRHK